MVADFFNSRFLQNESKRFQDLERFVLNLGQGYVKSGVSLIREGQADQFTGFGIQTGGFDVETDGLFFA